MKYDEGDLMKEWSIKSIKKAPKALKTKIDLTFEPHWWYKNYKNKLVVNMRLD